MTNQSQYDAWIYDQLHPDERLYVGRRAPRSYALFEKQKGIDKFLNEHPEYKGQIDLTDKENEARQDEFLKKHTV